MQTLNWNANKNSLVENGLGEWPFLVVWFDLDLDLLGEWGQQFGTAGAEAQVGDAGLENLVDDGLKTRIRIRNLSGPHMTWNSAPQVSTNCRAIILPLIFMHFYIKLDPKS